MFDYLAIIQKNASLWRQQLRILKGSTTYTVSLVTGASTFRLPRKPYLWPALLSSSIVVSLLGVYVPRA